jgi:hypothetical protein
MRTRHAHSTENEIRNAGPRSGGGKEFQERRSETEDTALNLEILGGRRTESASQPDNGREYVGARVHSSMAPPSCLGAWSHCCHLFQSSIHPATKTSTTEQNNVTGAATYTK